MIFLRL